MPDHLIRFLVIDKRNGKNAGPVMTTDWRAAIEWALRIGFVPRADLRFLGTFRLDD